MEGKRFPVKNDQSFRKASYGKNCLTIDFFDDTGQFLSVFLQYRFHGTPTSGSGACVEAILPEYIF